MSEAPERFRPRGEGPPPPPVAEPPVLRFTTAAEALGSARDVLLGYQMFLGRDPESSFVIAEGRNTPVHGFMRGLLTSDEFTHSVLGPLEAGRPVPHERGSAGPDAEQIAWLLRHLQVGEAEAARLAEASDWRVLLRGLVGLPGFPRAQAVVPATADEPTAPEFVLITIEQPRGGDALAGGRVEGSGWVIAPSDVAEVSVLLGEQVLTQARSGLPRPDVARRFPHYREAGRSGFAFSADMPAALVGTGADLLTVVVRTVGGEQGRKTVRVQPPGGAARRVNGRAARVAPVPVATAEGLALLARIDRPAPTGDSVRVPAGQALALSGWALARAGVVSVAALLDDVLVGEAHRGLRREDIAAAFAGFGEALLSGWALVVPREWLTHGSHRVRVVVSDAAGASTEVSLSLWAEAGAATGLLRAAMPAPEAAFAQRLLAAQERRLFFTVVVRAGAGGGGLAATLESLERQVIPGWQAIVVAADDAARTLPVALRLGERVRFVAQDAWVAAVPAGTAGMVCALRAGDLLGCDALLEFAVAAAMSPAADLFYADERRDGEALFKPDFAPEQLLGMNYVGRAWCAAARLAGSVAELARASDYDAVLRLSEAAKRVVHVPRVLMERGPAADGPAQEAAALAAAADRRGFKAEIYSGRVAGVWQLRRMPGAGEAPGVSIVIPTKGAGNLVRQAIASIRTTAGRAVEIVVVDDLPASSKSLRAWLRKQADVVVRAEGAFNWSRFSNQGARAASGEVLLFLNDDIDAPGRGWLEAMLEQAVRPEVGVVGAQLVYPGGRVQHAGLYLDGSVGRHAFRFHAAGDAADAGPFGLAAVTREVVGVTGACLMTRRDVFERLGGFDEAHGIINNDLDFCLRARAEGLDVIYTPHARLVHHELASRAGMPDSFDAAAFAERFRTALPLGDPFRNAQLAANDDQYAADQEPVAFLYAGKPGRPRQEVRRILVVKLDHIGDFVVALPALRALRAHFPKAQLSLLAPPATAALAGLAPEVDEVIAFTFYERRSADGRSEVGEEALAALEAMLSPQRFDVAIDLRMHPETRSVLRRTGAGFLAGYDHEGRFPWLDVALEWEGDTRLLLKRGPIGERLLQLAHATAAAFAPAMPPVGAGDAVAKAAVLAMLPDGFAGLPLACVHPGAGNLTKQWPAASFAAVIDLLVADGMAVVLVGSAEEAGVADAVLRHAAPGAPVCSLAGSLELALLPALLQACALFVGNDSGPKHLAGSLGVPTVGVHSGVVDAREWGPAGHAAVAVQKQMVCGPCYIATAEDCPRALACLTGVRARDVYAACRRVMAVGVAPIEVAPIGEATDLDEKRKPAGERGRREVPALLGAGALAEAERLAERPLQPEGGPQGYIETVASDGSGTVWVVGWMRRGHPLEFPAAVAGREQHGVAVALMMYPRADLPADAYGVIGIVAGAWQPALGEDGKPEAFTLFFGETGRFHLRCHAPLRVLSVEKLAGEYQELLARGRAMRQSPSLQRLLGALEVWEPTRAGAAWLGVETSVDRILLVPGLGCFVEGWILSPLRRIETLRLRVGGVVMTLMPQTLEWKRRQDLASVYPASAAMAARAGFVGLFEGTEEPADVADAVLKLVFEGGASVNWGIPPKVFRRLGQSARLEEARVFFPALEEEAFFPRFAAAAVRAERALVAPPLVLQAAAAERVLVFVLPQERCDRFLLFEEVARRCRPGAAGGFDGVLFVGVAGPGRSDALWMFREFVRDLPGMAASLVMIGEQGHAFGLLPEVLAAVGARRFLFVADGVFLTEAGWEAVPRVLAQQPAALVCLAASDMVAGARCFGWSTTALGRWSDHAVTFLGGIFGDNGFAALSPGVVPDAVRMSRAGVSGHLQDAVNRALAGPAA